MSDLVEAEAEDIVWLVFYGILPSLLSMYSSAILGSGSTRYYFYNVLLNVNTLSTSLSKSSHK